MPSWPAQHESQTCYLGEVDVDGDGDPFELSVDEDDGFFNQYPLSPLRIKVSSPELFKPSEIEPLLSSTPAKLTYAGE
jgi:hypothetical protein